MMNQIQEWTPSVLLSLGAQAMGGPINSIVTNVPGPQIPLYLHGARLRALYPAVPLMEGMGLGIALTSYAGTMGIGFPATRTSSPTSTSSSRASASLSRRSRRRPGSRSAR
ncbi:MAG: WS/DGAT domain-containing protein [Myxococcota bacterium]